MKSLRKIGYSLALLSVLFVSGCIQEKEKKSDKHLIAKIPEASGICYSAISDSLFVAQDEGFIYEITPKGKILRKVNIGKYDLEGVACDDQYHQLYFAVEKKESILVVDMKNLQILKEIKIDRDYQSKTVIKKDKEYGIEGITLANGALYLSNQSYNVYPDKDASIVFKVDGLQNKQAKIIDIIDHGFVDVAGLSYHNGYLYMVSDKEDLLITYDIARNKTVQKKKLPKFAQEGITFDGKENIYFADDKKGILKYESKAFE